MEVDEPSGLNSDSVSLRNSMLQHLSMSDEAHFKSQQLNEPDLTSHEKRLIAEEILDRNPGCFLSRFGKFLLETHLDYFIDMAKDNYEVNYYITDLRKNFQKTFSKSVIRNRRFEALRRLTLDGEYFSDEEMRKRNPVMYEQLVGQYLTEDEKIAMTAERLEAKSFSSIILNAVDEKEIEDKLKRNEKEIEIDDLDRDSDCSSGAESAYLSMCSPWGEFHSVSNELSGKKTKKRKKRNKNKPETLSEDEKVIMMNEFRSRMYSEFLGGKDTEFDYSSVDANNDYDDLDMLEIDQQDKYFDSESPEFLVKGEGSSESLLSLSGLPPPKDLVQKMAELET